MSIHQEIKNSLYDYIMGELSPEERETVRAHLAGCRSCAADHKQLQETLALVVRPSDQPDRARSEEFWKTFAARVEQEIGARSRRSRFAWAHRLRDSLQSLLVMRGGQVALGGLATAMALLAAVLLLKPAPQAGGLAADTTGSHPAEGYAANAAPADSAQSNEAVEEYAPNQAAPPVQYASDRVGQYFRRSKILLIGIANMKEEPDSSLDLRAERKTSRDLVQEARYIKSQQNLDPHARQLIDQLNRILIELANLADKDQAPGVQLIRSGIRQENLLFKIRMAEVALDTARYSGKTREIL
ncbi:MAG TPA: zf-HC2 domain-containing protein [Bacteroidota bacterium]